IEHRRDDLVVAGTAAQIAREPVASLFLGGIGVAIEQRLGRDQHPRRADAALERRMLEEFLLQRMELGAFRHALDRLDRLAVHLGAEDEAGAHQAAVDRHAARAAIAARAALLGAGEVELVAQHVEQRLLRLAQVFDGIAVDRRRHVVLGHQFTFLARSSAICAARRASTPATLMRYSRVPRLSSMGRQAALAAAASRPSAASSTLVPISAADASETSNGRSATAPSATRALRQTPSASSARLTPAETTAMSISVRGVKRRYASAA